MRNSVYFANSKLIIKPRIAAQNNTTKREYIKKL